MSAPTDQARDAGAARAAGAAGDIKERIRGKALASGFDLVGFAPPATGTREQTRLGEFLRAGQHGDMGWMARHVERRRTPQGLWPEVRSVIVCAANYGPTRDPLGDLAATASANISVYARNRDYHDLMKKRLKVVGRWMAAEFGAELKVFVDTAPVLEKPLAHAAGIGWQAKHSNLVSRRFGAWLFLGEIYTDLALPPDAPEEDHCGSCRQCLDICPTDAFPAPYTLDATRCISYLTIEHKGHIPEALRHAVGNRVYGCDDCLAICPWNKFAQQAREVAWHARADLDLPPLVDFLTMDDAGFRQRFAGSPIKRIGRDRFLRNVLIALANTKIAPPPALAGLLEDPSPLVRAMAIWATGKLATPEVVAAYRQHYEPQEHDPEVKHEWHRATASRSSSPAPTPTPAPLPG